MDNARRLALIREAQRQGINIRNVPPPVVSLEAFFTGEDEDDDPEWPHSERIYVLSSASHEEVADWPAALHPDSLDEGFALGVPEAAPHLQPGMKVYSEWWD